MIVGNEILKRDLIKNGVFENLKNSTYDLTIGRIFPIGKEVYESEPLTKYLLKPKEIIWILSNEEFNMPSDVTGVATLRTTYTKQGLLALNVGLIDPHFKGPISTALINFSDVIRVIEVNDKFFRVAFFEHKEIEEEARKPEKTERATYTRDLEKMCLSEYSPSFLNISSIENELYKQFWKMVWKGIWDYRNVLIVAGSVLFAALTYFWAVDKINISVEIIPSGKEIVNVPGEKNEQHYMLGY